MAFEKHLRESIKKQALQLVIRSHTFDCTDFDWLINDLSVDKWRSAPGKSWNDAATVKVVFTILWCQQGGFSGYTKYSAVLDLESFEWSDLRIRGSSAPFDELNQQMLLGRH